MRGFRRQEEKERFRAGFPRAGFEANRQSIPLVESLTDAQLDELNSLLHWNCFVADSKGRRFGAPTKKGKRDTPEPIPDPRLALLVERFGLADKSVLEVGCFEGIHTIGLCRTAARVTAIDARVENVVKTIVRCALFGARPSVFVHDVEQTAPPPQPLDCDVAHHVGVLYHLRDPVGHLARLGPLVRLGMMVDTHYAEPDQATKEHESSGRRFRHFEFEEGGHENVFAGVYDHAKWLTLDGLREALGLAGFPKVEIVRTDVSRNGPRVLLFATRR
jgi:tRNA (mo5U34)-methyltransferase